VSDALLLSIDPGLRGCGCAWWTKDAGVWSLHSAAYVSALSHEPEDKDDDGKSLNDYAKWERFSHKVKCNYKFTSNKDHMLSQLNTKQLREARLARIEEIKVK
jgi:hypothetical protein